MPSPREVDPADAVDGGDAVDLARGPGLPRVGSALEDEHIADALLRHGLEIVAHGDFRNAVAIVIVDIEVDGAGNVLDDDVALPGGILEPGEFGAALVHHDEVGAAVAVEVGGDKLVAHLQGVGDGGLAPLRQFRAGKRCGEKEYEDEQHRPKFIRDAVAGVRGMRIGEDEA